MTAAYWANGLVNTLSVLNNSNVPVTGLPTWTYAPDGEGRVAAMSVSGTSVATLPATGYNLFGLPAGVNFASGDSDTFTYDSNTGRMIGYQAALAVLPSVSLAVTGAQSGSTYSDADSFTVTVKGAPNQPVAVNGYPMGTTNSSGVWTTSGGWSSIYDGTYSQVWSVNGVAASPTLNFTVASGQPTPAGPSPSVLGPLSAGTLTWNANGSLAQLATMDGFNSGSVHNFGNSQTCAYTHDDLGRLSTVDCGSGKWGQNFTYGNDNFGNVNWSTPGGHVGTSFQFGYDPATNHYTGAPQYDLNGNLLSDVAHTYTWDAAGNLYQIDAWKCNAAQPG